MKELPEHYPAPPVPEAIPPTERVLEFLISERGKDADLLFSLANVLLRKGRTAEALKNYRGALELSPHSPKLRTNLGVALLLLGEVEDAEKQFRQALLQEPALELALLHLGTMLEERGEFESALKLLERFLQARLTPRPALLAARCAAAVGKLELARGYYEEAAGGGIEEALAWLLADDVKNGATVYELGDIVECGRILHRNYERSPGLFLRDQRVQDAVRKLSTRMKEGDRLVRARQELIALPAADRAEPLYRYLLEVFLSLGVLPEVFEELSELEGAASRWAKAIGEAKTYPYGNYRHAIILAYGGSLGPALDELDLCRSKLPEKKQHMLKLRQIVETIGELQEVFQPRPAGPE